MPKQISILSLLKTEYQNSSVFCVVTMVGGILAAVAGVRIPLWLMGIAGVVSVSVFFLKSLLDFRPLAKWILFALLGFGVMTLRLSGLSPQMEIKPLYDVDVTGRVDRVFGAPDKPKLVLSHVRFLNRWDVVAPERVQLTARIPIPKIAVGDEITVTTSIRAPHKALAPFAYDEALHLAFDHIHAVGTIQKVKQVRFGKTGLRRRIEEIRTNISDRITRRMPAEVAQIAVPLVIGNQDGVSPHLYDLFRSAGITHVLSVSGFHLSLLVAFVFLIVRRVLSLFPWFGNRLPAKKVAAIIALVGAVLYVGLSGMQVPAMRSLMMVGIVLIALFFDREALSVRSWAVAAFCLLIWRPELILNIGFQLSFMAVLVLVTLYPMLRDSFWPRQPRSLWQRIGVVLGGFILVDALMTMVTTPFVLYYFNRWALYSCLGNVLTGALFSFWIMPLLFLGLFLMPIGGEGIFLTGAAVGLEYVITVCEKIHALPHSVVLVPAFSAEALGTMTIGVLMLCLMKTRLRLAGVVVMGIGCALAIGTPRPDVMIGDGGLTVAVRDNQGLRFLKRSPSDYTVRLWLLRNGEDPDKPVFVRSADAVSIKGKTVAFESSACSKADICFLPDPRPKEANAWSLYDARVRFVYIRDDDIVVKTP